MLINQQRGDHVDLLGRPFDIVAIGLFPAVEGQDRVEPFRASAAASSLIDPLTPDGIEVAHLIRKHQFSINGQSVFQQFAAPAA